MDRDRETKRKNGWSLGPRPLACTPEPQPACGPKNYFFIFFGSSWAIFHGLFTWAASRLVLDFFLDRIEVLSLIISTLTQRLVLPNFWRISSSCPGINTYCSWIGKHRRWADRWIPSPSYAVFCLTWNLLRKVSCSSRNFMVQHRIILPSHHLMLDPPTPGAPSRTTLLFAPRTPSCTGLPAKR